MAIRRRLLAWVMSAACALLLAGPAHAADVDASRREQLRCPGRAGPRPGFHFEAQWHDGRHLQGD